MVPSARVVGLLLNPRFGVEAANQHRESVAAAAQALGRELIVQEAATDAQIDASFAEMVKAAVAALIVQNDPFFDSRRSQILALSSRHQLPGIFHIREFPADGGLMSYGASLSDTYRQVGVYAGKILRGAKSDDSFQFCGRQSSNSSSTQRPLRRLALPCHSRFSSKQKS